jgi:hypothetical protein
MKTITVLCISFLMSNLVVAQSVKLPASKKSVLIDGYFDEDEWKDGTSLTVGDSLTLYFKQDPENLYWCLRSHHRIVQLAGVDFYFSKGETLTNLHASAKLGERLFNGKDYGDWIWWNNREWTANVVKLDVPESRKFFRDECKEFQIRKSFSRESRARLMFTIQYPKNLETRFPADASEMNAEHWLDISW